MILAPGPRILPSPLPLEGEVLTTGAPEKSPQAHFFFFNLSNFSNTIDFKNYLFSVGLHREEMAIYKPQDYERIYLSYLSCLAFDILL